MITQIGKGVGVAQVWCGCFQQQQKKREREAGEMER